MKYDVIQEHEGIQEKIIAVELSKSDAVKTALCASRHKIGKIYIRWYRPSDHQTGYLNPDGGHMIIGQPW